MNPQLLTPEDRQKAIARAAQTLRIEGEAVLRLGDRLYVSNWGGRLPVEGDRTASSSGTPVRLPTR